MKDRKVFIDYLRVIATFSVIVLHTAAGQWTRTDVNSFAWQVFNFTNGVVRWGVPVFVMISGSLFLQREISLEKLYSKYVLRMIAAYLVWSLFYAVFEEGDVIYKFQSFIIGHTHMWFILMIIGVYACIPLIKPIADSDFRSRYYLVLALIFAYVIPEAVTLINDFGGETVIKSVNTINVNVVGNMNMYIVLGYVSYFILGYRISKVEFSKQTRLIIYALGLVGFAFTVVMSDIVSLKTQQPCDNYYSFFSVNVLLQSIAVYIWFKYKEYGNEHMNAFVQKLSKYCFGAYLVHMFILEQLDDIFGITTLSFNPVLSVISISLFAIIVSFIVSGVLNRIPVINKYIV